MLTISEKTRRRYDRLAPYYDGLEAFMEGLVLKQKRQLLWQQANGADILEVGVGTGKNFAYYPDNARMTAIDFSDKMLQQARKKRDRIGTAVELEQMDIETLYFADNCFDTVVATYVFCSVAHPKKGLRELHRVCKPGGQVLLLEHVLSAKPLLAKLMNAVNPFVKSVFGANINRQTIKNVQAASFQKVFVDPGSSDLIKVIRAIK